MVGVAIASHSVQGRSPPVAAEVMTDAIKPVARIQVLNGYGHENAGVELMSTITDLKNGCFRYDLGRGTDADWKWTEVQPNQQEADLIIWLVCLGCVDSATRVVASLQEIMMAPQIVLINLQSEEAILVAPTPMGNQFLKLSEFLDRIDDFIT